MIRKGILLLAGLLIVAGLAQGETIRLASGDSIRGKIIRVDNDSISVESEKGYGVLQIKRSEITLIEFEGATRDPQRTMGLGYFHRSTPNTTSAQSVEYGVDSISLKFWMSETFSLDLLLGFFSHEQGGAKVFEVFSFETRLATVFSRQSSLDFYYGISLGYLDVVDNSDAAAPFEDSGSSWQVFLGGEVFFVTMPNLGISAEIGFGSQSVGDREITNISTTTFPSFSMRYYF